MAFDDFLGLPVNVHVAQTTLTSLYLSTHGINPKTHFASVTNPTASSQINFTSSPGNDIGELISRHILTTGNPMN